MEEFVQEDIQERERLVSEPNREKNSERIKLNKKSKTNFYGNTVVDRFYKRENSKK
jgi:hypothetical protein